MPLLPALFLPCFEAFAEPGFTLNSRLMSITSNKSQHAFGFGSPATYRIVIQGVLSAEWSGRLAGLLIATTDPEIGPPQTTLEGRIHDQAELNGVLTTLYGLHLPLLSVEKLQEETSVGGPG